MEMDPQKLRQIRRGLSKPEAVSDNTYSHAASLLTMLAENIELHNDRNTKGQERIQRIIARIKEKVQAGILPQETLDLLGYEEEPIDWRE